VSACLDAALAFLGSTQLASGEFPTFKARDPGLVEDRVFDSTPFATTYILHSLGFVDRPRAREMVQGGLNFLEAEMEPHGVWRYWSSIHPRHRSIPPDLDDTCCASFVMRRFDRQTPPNAELVLANRDRSGLFYTWLIPRPIRTRSRAWWSVTLRQVPISPQRLMFWYVTNARPGDVDCVVNANVLACLGDRAEARPIVELLSEALREGRAGSCDKWHSNACAFYYAVARAYASGVTALAPLCEPLAVQAEATLAAVSDLAAAEVALAACALLSLGRRSRTLEEMIRRLATDQREDGSWPAYPLYHGGPWGWGSEALTTGLCIEALARFSGEPPMVVESSSS
jgi:hypothetical protein